MQTKLAAACLVAALLGATAAHAQSQPSSSASNATKKLNVVDAYIIDQIGPMWDKSQRRGLASKLIKHFTQLDNSFADITPAEKAWLNKNYYEKVKKSGTLTAETMEISDTKIYHASVAKDTIAAYLEILERLEDEKNDLNLDDEIILWETLASYFDFSANFVNDITYLAKNSKSVNDVFDWQKNPSDTFSSLETYFGNLVLQSYTISNSITLPYLKTQKAKQ
jgi:uncharacterized protein (UPF0335 family)